jgi:glutamate/tyrosine decarboxylase-like PLP-dependent enzyme
VPAIPANADSCENARSDRIFGLAATGESMPANHEHEDPRVRDLHAAIRRASELALAWTEQLPDRPITAGATPEQMAGLLDEPLPESGTDPGQAVAEWLDRAAPGIVSSTGPRYFGFVTGVSLPAALGGDIIASTVDQNGGIWSMSPAGAQTELTVIRWLKELLSLPADWHGVMTSGATMSNLVGLAAARQWVGEQLGFNPAEDGLGGRPVIPVVSSAAIHASARKALGNLGLGRQAVRTVPAPGGVVDIGDLRDALDLTKGPAIVVANAGEVNTGQFDDIDAIADVCAEHEYGAWLHVDGAFGLFAAASSDYRDRVKGIERAESVAADGHKWLNVPYDSGFAFVRDERALRSAFATSGAAYLAGSGGWDADDFSAEMSRRVRAIPAWCALRSLGREGYRELIDRCIANAVKLAEWADEQPWLELMNAERMRETPFMVACVRFTDQAWDDAEHDRRNRELLAALQADGRVYASTTIWDGKAAMRFAFDNWMTTEDDVEVIFDVLRDVRDRASR